MIKDVKHKFNLQKSKNFKHKVNVLTVKEVEANRCSAYKYIKL